MIVAIRLLAVIAVIQAALIFITWTGDSELKSHVTGSTLLSFKQADVKAMVIKDEDNEVHLEKKEKRWQLAGGFPADQKKVEGLLDNLAELKFSLPVGTSAQALSRFKVADDNFSRYLQLKSSDNSNLAELYLGTGAGARQSHIRNGKQESVFTAAIGSYDLPATQDNWQDKEILKLDMAKVTAITLDDLKLHREAQDGESEEVVPWETDTLSEGETIDQQAVNGSLEKLTNLRFTQVLGQKELPEYGLSDPSLRVTLKYIGGQRSYTFGKMNESEDVVLKVSDREDYFQVASFSAKSILEELGREKLLKGEKATDNGTETDSQTK